MIKRAPWMPLECLDLPKQSEGGHRIWDLAPVPGMPDELTQNPEAHDREAHKMKSNLQPMKTLKG